MSNKKQTSKIFSISSQYIEQVLAVLERTPNKSDFICRAIIAYKDSTAIDLKTAIRETILEMQADGSLNVDDLIIDAKKPVVTVTPESQIEIVEPALSNPVPKIADDSTEGLKKIVGKW